MNELVKAEVITIGDEILFGQITDTNTQWIGSQLTDIGIRPAYKSSVGDIEDDILHALYIASQRADIVIITGGLGPTKDDITKHTLCTFFGTELAIDNDALDFITDFFKKRGREMTHLNIQQAALPSNATYIPNRWGTAPGMWFEKNEVIYVSLPGVPYEMKNLMEHEILSRLKKRYSGIVIKHKIVKTIGLGESFLAEKIEPWEDALPAHIRLAYLPHFGQVRLRLTATGTDEARLDHELNIQVQGLMPYIHDYVFGYDQEEMETVIGQLLCDQKATLGLAESCTGGFVSHRLTTFPGSSAFLQGSVVSYSNEAKVRLLGVQQQTLDDYGAVSEQTVIEMAEGAKTALNADFSIAITGVAGPEGGSPEKPVGTIWIACSSPAGTKTQLLQLKGSRLINIEMTSSYVLNLLRKSIISYYRPVPDQK